MTPSSFEQKPRTPVWLKCSRDTADGVAQDQAAAAEVLPRPK